MAEFLAEKRREITARLDELRPAVEEYQELERAAAALDGVGGVQPRRRGPGRPPGSTNRESAKPTTSSRRGRRRGGGKRAAEALKLVRANPGITIPELAGKMKMDQNYLYRVLPALERDGLVRRDGRNWQPAKT
jgi:MarR family